MEQLLEGDEEHISGVSFFLLMDNHYYMLIILLVSIRNLIISFRNPLVRLGPYLWQWLYWDRPWPMWIHHLLRYNTTLFPLIEWQLTVSTYQVRQYRSWNQMKILLEESMLPNLIWPNDIESIGQMMPINKRHPSNIDNIAYFNIVSIKIWKFADRMFLSSSHTQ